MHSRLANSLGCIAIYFCLIKMKSYLVEKHLVWCVWSPYANVGYLDQCVLINIESSVSKLIPIHNQNFMKIKCILFGLRASQIIKNWPSTHNLLFRCILTVKISWKSDVEFNRLLRHKSQFCMRMRKTWFSTGGIFDEKLSHRKENHASACFGGLKRSPKWIFSNSFELSIAVPYKRDF